MEPWPELDCAQVIPLPDQRGSAPRADPQPGQFRCHAGGGVPAPAGAPRSAGFGEQELLARLGPADDRKAVAALEAGSGIEFEGAEEGRCAESPGGAQWVVRAELEAAAGD